MRHHPIGAALLAAVLLGGGCGPGDAGPPAGPHTVVLHAHGLRDQGDADRLKTAIEAHAGVLRVRVDPSGDIAISVADGRATRAATLVEVIAKAGFQAHEGGH